MWKGFAMKNIFEIMSAMGIEIPEDKKADITKQVAENYKTVAEFDKVKTRLETERDNYKDSYETAQNALKEFDGVDVKDLNGKITKLTEDLKQKDADYQAKISDMEFNSVLDNAISASKAKSSKALKALLDVDALKASKNQTEDIKSAIDAVKAENGYLFESDEPIRHIVRETIFKVQYLKLQLVSHKCIFRVVLRKESEVFALFFATTKALLV